MAVTLTPNGGTAAVVMGATSQVDVNRTSYPPSIPIIIPRPVQVVGFVPLTDCNDDECRYYDTCCYINPVFGASGPGATYENDINSFLVYYGLWINNNLTASVVWTIQEAVDGIWSDLVTITDQSLGNWYDLNSLSTHNQDLAPYSGFQVDWGLVFGTYGEGTYRIKCQGDLNGSLSECLVSEPFCLKEFVCIKAHSTVKFEAWITGQIGSATIDGTVYNLCSLLWYDSIRFKGLFGYEATEYDETLLEYQTGLQERVRDEAIQKFQLKTGLLPHWLHERFKTYGLMSDKLFVSDYNYNNPDYSYNRKSVIKAGGYAPDYKVKGYGSIYSRLSRVTVDFKEGIQGVIKSLCCPSRTLGT